VVNGKKALNEFVSCRLPCRNEPHWVPPLRMAFKELLESRKHPVLRQRAGRVLLARQAAGRSAGSPPSSIAIIIASTRKRRVSFGFFDCIDAQAWRAPCWNAPGPGLSITERSLLPRPVNPSTNYECGCSD